MKNLDALTLLEAARQKEIGLLNLCGGNGVGGKCKIQIVTGQGSKAFAEERKRFSQAEFVDGYRLACKTYPVSLEGPSLSDLRGNDQRLLDAFKRQHGISCREPAQAILKTMSPLLRSTDWKASVAVDGAEIISVAPPDTQTLGVAIDPGTTKIAGYLVDLESRLMP